jgi:hypothetical protein
MKHGPEQGVAELCSGLRVGGDAAGIVVGRAGHEAGAELLEERDAADTPSEPCHWDSHQALA